MKKPGLFLFCAAVCLLSTCSLNADVYFASPTWTRDAAVAAANDQNIQANLRPLFLLAREGKSQQLLAALQALEEREDLAVPAREKVLHSFASGLGDLETQPSPRVLEYLQTYQPMTLVPHDHHAAIGVPLFNIRAAAAGADAQHRRLAGWTDAMALTAGDPMRWIDAYLAADGPGRQGFRLALESARAGEIAGIAEAALEKSATEPALATVAVRGGIALADPGLFQIALSAATETALASELRSAAERFDADQVGSILEYTLRRAKPSTAALTLAILAPGALPEPRVANLLIGALEDPALGSSAALVLAASDDPAIQQRLSGLTRDPGSLAAKRLDIAVASEQSRRGAQK